MISEKMKKMVSNSSVIRAMFEEGKRLEAEAGKENVYDFSIGNPSLEPPAEIAEAMREILEEEEPNFIHGYMANAGYEDVRTAVADSLNRRFGTSYGEKNILMTVGAAGGLNVILKALVNPGDEVVVFAPYFGEYNSYVSNVDGVITAVSPDPSSFRPKLKEFEEKLNARTKCVLINNPNNPTGVVYTEETIRNMADILRNAQKKYKTEIYLISDEPYRELVYDGVTVPYLPDFYENTIVGYSFSKSLSLPGERIGYLAIPDSVADFEDVLSACVTANRILGYVNAPSFFQRVVGRCIDAKVDIEKYDKNRRYLYDSLCAMGYESIKPQGAFYLFLKTLEEDDKAFAEKAKKHHLLLVPGSAFGCPGYVRIAYCVDYDMITRALPAFKALKEEYK